MCEQPKQEFTIVGRSERKVDGIALVTGKPKFVTDIDLSNMLYVKILHSPTGIP
jgi:CO/xanthine dehydrogenase Mo-binding subunit